MSFLGLSKFSILPVTIIKSLTVKESQPYRNTSTITVGEERKAGIEILLFPILTRKLLPGQQIHLLESTTLWQVETE